MFKTSAGLDETLGFPDLWVSAAVRLWRPLVSGLVKAPAAAREHDPGADHGVTVIERHDIVRVASAGNYRRADIRDVVT